MPETLPIVLTIRGFTSSVYLSAKPGTVLEMILRSTAGIAGKRQMAARRFHPAEFVFSFRLFLLSVTTVFRKNPKNFKGTC